MKIEKTFLLTLALFLVGMTGFSSTVSATTGAGGQVNSKGQITFYDGTIESSTTEPSTSLPPEVSSSTVPITQKPQGGGTYPSTGEMIRKYSLMGFGLIAALLLIFLFNRRKKEEQ
ncbi:LPXTG cell wall anchor domain-containing protein [Candidatus Enterococcus clewellii]|uniref:Gram-positive cocci surface proteins LPxTG domain-containing protein n=1 Tax=Candidatus Enterococcus clewellii TaxID=1834193 RepID=A0A242K8V3_9ENTE|nr:LPXTG cell wall anchor domain-containing protein [Enterococcus sp. 9E7_DIV0242]OTP17601.1 hypothetical protein A5888_001739 [Enterococcus sp. 9E7_DIV0242]